jgi:hypothetical protein
MASKATKFGGIFRAVAATSFLFLVFLSGGPGETHSAQLRNNIPPCSTSEAAADEGGHWTPVSVVIPRPASWSHDVHWWLLYPLRHQQHFYFDVIDPVSRKPLDVGSWLFSSASHAPSADGFYYKCLAARVELSPELLSSGNSRLRMDNQALARMAVLLNGYGPCVRKPGNEIPPGPCRKLNQLLPWLPPEPAFVVADGHAVVDMTTRYALRLNWLPWLPGSSREASVIGRLDSYRLVITARRKPAAAS